MNVETVDGTKDAGDSRADTDSDGAENMRQALKGLGFSEEKLAEHAIDNAAIQRFLRARNHDITKASHMLAEHIKWRESILPNGKIDESEISKELADEKAYLQVKDGQRSIIVLLANKHDALARNLEEFKKFAVYSIEKALACLPSGDEKFGVVLDMGGCGLRNMDPKAMICVFGFLQAQYPERLGRLFIIHVPYIFWGIWTIVSPFIDKVTKEKIKFVQDKNVVETLASEIPGDMLPAEYGGTGKLTLVQDVVLQRTLAS